MDCFICEGVRTPIGRYGGGLAAVRPDDLAADVIRQVLARSGASGEVIDDVVMGCANQAGEDNRNVARMAALLAGLPDTVGGVTVNRLCASGLEAVAQAARAVATSEQDLVIAGGVESMSRAPFVMGKATRSFDRATQLEDTTIGWRFVNPAMQAAYGTDSMPETAENVAQQFGIGRGDQDAFAMRSQQRVAQAQKDGRFERSLMSIVIREGENAGVVTADEHPRAGVTLDRLAALAPIVRADGTVTAGNAAGVNDGATALIIANARGVERHGLTPRARILGYAVCGVAPRIMGIGPLAATARLTERLDRTVASFDVIELNEAFAAQALAVTRRWGIRDDADHVNPWGGAIALGHPLGMTGARIVLNGVDILEAHGADSALVTLCVGVGQGAALALERMAD